MNNTELREEILRLKKDRNAIILAHSYQRPEIQDIADFVGDSLALARKAQETECDVIVFCGVRFMAETACILNPTRRVLLPDMNAGCSLEASCAAEALAAALEAEKDANYYVVAYINSSIEVKALADIIVTSGNASRIVEAAPKGRPILFVPDRNLGSWTAMLTEKPMVLWNGACHVHERFTREQVLAAREQYPDAKVICHPECEESVREVAHHICSTEKMIGYCSKDSASRYIVVTETGILHRLRKLVPGKEFISVAGDDAAPCAVCEYMKLNTLEKLRDCLRDMAPEMKVPEDLRKRAEIPLKRMLELS